MAIDQKKKSAIVAKDGSGNLFQVLPETAAECVAYDSSNAAVELARQDSVDVSEAFAEVESESETVVEDVHLPHTGTLTASPDSAGHTLNVSFAVELAGTYNGSDPDEPLSYNIGGNYDLPIANFKDEDGYDVTDRNEYFDDNGNVLLPSNIHFSYDFRLEYPGTVIYSLNAFLSGCAFYDENGIKDHDGNTIAITGSSVNPDSEYTTTYYENSNVASLGSAIEFTLPSVGQSTTVYFNTWIDFQNHNMENWGNIENLNKSLTFENLDGTNYRMIFYWNTREDVHNETTYTQNKLATSIERKSGSTEQVVKPMDGFLNNLNGSVKRSFAVERKPASGRYSPYIYIGMSTFEAQ